MENACIIESASLKKIIEKRTVNMIEEFATGDTIPIFPMPKAF